MKKSGKDRLKQATYESTLSTAARSPFPNEEGKEEAASPPKKEANPPRCARDDETRERLFPFLFNLLRKPTPPRCARQPLPREGARVDTPSFLWKEVPRRGGGWVGEVVSPKQSLPRVGKVASGASRIGY